MGSGEVTVSNGMPGAGGGVTVPPPVLPPPPVVVPPPPVAVPPPVLADKPPAVFGSNFDLFGGRK